jgi:hypothetical protein
MRFTDTHKSIIERGATGHCVRWVWHWVLDGQPVTRQVNFLIKRGLIEATYFRSSASTSATESGREAIA